MPEDKPKPKDEEPKNPIAKATMDEIMAQNESYMKTIGEKDALIVDLTGKLKEANDILEAQTKSAVIHEILPRSRFTIDELKGKSIEELKAIKSAVDSATPTHPNIHAGARDAALTEREQGLTVGNLYGKKAGEQ